MQNFHFNPTNNRSVHLIKQLQQIDRQLDAKRNELNQKKKLEEEFYQDKQLIKNRNYENPNLNKAKPLKDNNLNLADQIMNQLLMENKSKKLDHLQSFPRRNQGKQMYQNMNNFKMPPSQGIDYDHKFISPSSQTQNNNQYQGQIPYQQNNAQNQHQHNYKIPNSQEQKTQVVPRQNNFIQPPVINKRELQKQKLQNPTNNSQDNPFLPRNQPIRRSVQANQQRPIVNQRELQKMKLQQQSSQQQNPFWGEGNSNGAQRNNRSFQRNIPQQQFENIREKQKQKLQQQFNSINDVEMYQRQRAKSPTNQQQVPAERQQGNQNIPIQISKQAAFQNRNSNPFVKDQDYIKQKKGEQLREYRRALQQQKKIDEERKIKQKQMVKQQKYAFNAYEPGIVSNKPGVNMQQNSAEIKSPQLNLTKKHDPNGKPPAFTEQQKNYTAPSDLMYMKMKATQLRENHKKGRILHDQYIEQIRKLAEFYKVDFKELIDKKDLDDGDEDLPWIKQANKKKDQKKTGNNAVTDQVKPTKNEAQQFQIVQNDQSLQRFPDSQISLRRNFEFNKQSSSPSKNQRENQQSYNLGNNFTQPPFPQYNPYAPTTSPNMYTQNLSSNVMSQQYGLASTAFMQQFPQMEHDLVRRMFDQLKAMRTDYTKSLQNQKNFLQQTFMKFMSNNMMQQQLNAQMQNGQQSSSNHEQKNDVSPKPNNKHPQHQQNKNILLQSSHENMTDQSLQLIEKSLSGIVNKIPFYSNSVNKNNNDPSIGAHQNNTYKKQNKGVKVETRSVNPLQQTVQQFFNKPYTLKRFKKFSIMVDVTQSSIEIPNVSNFLSLKNGKDVVNRLFEEDLLKMKKLQRQRDVDKLRTRVQNQLSYGDTFSHGTQVTNNKNTGNFTVLTAGENNTGASKTMINNQNIYSTNQKQKLVTQNSKYQEYQNYSRSRNPNGEGKSPHQQNHRSYKKAQNQAEEFPSSAFLKRHVSNQQQQSPLPNFADQSEIKVQSPVYYSPKLNSQILEQDEYQTAQKFVGGAEFYSEFYGSDVRNSTSPQQRQTGKYQMRKKDFVYQEERQSQKKTKVNSPAINNQRPSSKPKQKSQPKSIGGSKLGIMNIIQSNNQILHKYTVSPKNLNDYSPRKQQVDIKQYSSINTNPPQQIGDYFSGQAQGGSINTGPEYKQAPKVTANVSVNSNSQSSKYVSNRFDSQRIYDNEVQEHNKVYEQSLETVRSEENNSVEFQYGKKDVTRQQRPSKSKSPKHKSKSPYSRNSLHQEDQVNSQYMASMKQSEGSSKRVGQIHHSQTVESFEQSSSRLVRPPLQKKKSSSRKKESSIIRTKFQKDSILQKPPQSESQLNSMIIDSQDDDLVRGDPLKFDSNVYDSEYEQSVDQKTLHRRIQQLQSQQRVISNNDKLSLTRPQFSFGVPLIVTPTKQQSSAGLQPNQSSRVVNSSLINGNTKLKSLQQARNLAKQCKKKSISTSQNEQAFKYEQQMSQLQSFLTKKDDSILSVKQTTIVQNRQNKTIKLAIKQSPKKSASNKNIMNLLDDLQNQSSYRDDFESYREESQNGPRRRG